MPHTHDRIEFAPPAQPAPARSFGLAVLAHLFLLGALTWGVNWKSKTVTTTAEAELWASVPQQATPNAVEPPPPPPPAPPEPITPKPKPPTPVVEDKPAPQPREADIAIEREKQKKKQLEKERAEEKEAEKQEKLDEARQKKAADDAKKATDKKAQEAAQKKATDDAKREAQRKAAEAEKLAAAQAAKDEQQSAQQREANLKRMAGIAGSSGSPSDTGSAQQSSGPSSGYGARIKARVKPNLVFTSTVTGNPKVTLEIKMAPDGTILGRPRVLKSSGNREWDEAVVRAFEKTETLPRDADGRVHSPLEVGWSVND
jgi:colicin import membrane protein